MEARVAAGDTRVPLSRQRRAIAASMTQSARIPQFTLFRDADVSELATLRAALAPEQRFSYTDAISAACARTLRQHPAVNASFDEAEDCTVEHAVVNLGLGVPGREGLIVVVIQNANRLTATELAYERQRLTAAAKDGTLRAGELFGATFVISNLGTAGIHVFGALLVPPLAAILSVGAVRNAPGTSPALITLGLTLDHRALDGLAGAEFLNTLVTSLEDPHWLAVAKPPPAALESSWT